MSAVHCKLPVLASAVLGTSLWLLAFICPAAGFEEIKDPGASADSFVDTIAQSNDATAVTDRLAALARDRVTADDLNRIAGLLNALLAKATLPGHKDRLAEKRYGNAIWIFWYRVMYRGAEKDQFISVYIKLTFTRTIDYVLMTDFVFRTDLAKVDLP